MPHEIYVSQKSSNSNASSNKKSPFAKKKTTNKILSKTMNRNDILELNKEHEYSTKTENSRAFKLKPKKSLKSSCCEIS